MDRDAFERLYTEHARPLHAFLTYRTGNETFAEDLLADTFERVLKARRPFNPRKGSEKTWLYTIALNLLRDHLRRASIAKRSLEQVTATVTQSGGGDELEAVEHRDALNRAMACLAAEEREALALRFGAQLTVPEIARISCQKRSTIHGRVYRGLRKLKEELD